MIIKYYDIKRQETFTYDPENDILSFGQPYGNEQNLILDEKYFILHSNNAIRLAKGIDDFVDDYPEFFMQCLKERLKTFGINIDYVLTSSVLPIFTIDNNDDYCYFLLKFSDHIK